MTANEPSIADGWIDPDDAPLLTRDWFEQADAYNGVRLVRRGRPPVPAPKQQVSIRLDPDLIARLKADGPGWQGRVNAMLRKAVRI